MGKEENKEMLFWTTEEYKKFSDAIVDKPISFYEVRVVAGKKVARKMQMYLEAMLEELQFLQEKNLSDIDFDEMLMPLKHILTILKETD